MAQAEVDHWGQRERLLDVSMVDMDAVGTIPDEYKGEQQ